MSRGTGTQVKTAYLIALRRPSNKNSRSTSLHQHDYLTRPHTTAPSTQPLNATLNTASKHDLHSTPMPPPSALATRKTSPSNHSILPNAPTPTTQPFSTAHHSGSLPFDKHSAPTAGSFSRARAPERDHTPREPLRHDHSQLVDWVARSHNGAFIKTTAFLQSLVLRSS